MPICGLRLKDSLQVKILLKRNGLPFKSILSIFHSTLSMQELFIERLSSDFANVLDSEVSFWERTQNKNFIIQNDNI